MVLNIKIVNTPTMVRYITHSSDVRGKTLSIHKVFMKHYKNVRIVWSANLYPTFYHKRYVTNQLSTHQQWLDITHAFCEGNNNNK